MLNAGHILRFVMGILEMTRVRPIRIDTRDLPEAVVSCVMCMSHLFVDVECGVFLVYFHLNQLILQR